VETFRRHDVTGKSRCFPTHEKGYFSKNSSVLQLIKMGLFRSVLLQFIYPHLSDQRFKDFIVSEFRISVGRGFWVYNERKCFFRSICFPSWKFC